MIQEFSIENTYSIKTRQTISFEAANDDADDLHYCMNEDGVKLLKIAALYGPNASGKSNIIKSFDYYFRFILNAFSSLKPNENTQFMPFLFDEKTKNEPGIFDLVFYLNNIKYEYHLVMDSKCIHKEYLTFSPKKQRKLIFERECVNVNDDWEHLAYLYKWGDTFSGAKKNFESMTRPNATFINTAAQLNHPEMGEIYRYLTKIYHPMIIPLNQGLISYTLNQMGKNESIKNEFLNFLSAADINHINDIIIKEIEVPNSVIGRLPEAVKSGLNNVEGKYYAKEPLLSHNYGRNYYLPVNEESMGTRRLLELAGPFINIINNRRFLCIDEIDTSLHEEILEFFIKTFLEKSTCSQILFTSHNIELLDSGLLRDDEIWFIEKGNDGSSEYRSIVEYTGIRKETSRKKLYKAGKFGAWPIISSYTGEYDG
ncbi:hypothetical protein FACS189491_11610 [Spirochaetia bacterium]|nr:hypothetical protein FACS189491_11610 [Spirochaetia bacterium]